MKYIYNCVKKVSNIFNNKKSCFRQDIKIYTQCKQDNRKILRATGARIKYFERILLLI